MLQHFPFSTWYANQKQVSKQAHSRSQAIDLTVTGRLAMRSGRSNAARNLVNITTHIHSIEYSPASVPRAHDAIISISLFDLLS